MGQGGGGAIHYIIASLCGQLESANLSRWKKRVLWFVVFLFHTSSPCCSCFHCRNAPCCSPSSVSMPKESKIVSIARTLASSKIQEQQAFCAQKAPPAASRIARVLVCTHDHRSLPGKDSVRRSHRIEIYIFVDNICAVFKMSCYIFYLLFNVHSFVPIIIMSINTTIQ
jgi:hypothetical protein